MGMAKKVLLGILILTVAQIVLAGNGCNLADPECGSIPTNNCDVRMNTTFAKGIYSLPNGLDICSNNIIINCNSSKIETNSYYSQGVGIDIDGYNNTQISNCHLHRYSESIKVHNSAYDNLIMNNNITGEFYNNGIIIHNSHYNKITNNTISKNATYLSTDGIGVYGTNNFITNNSIIGNGNGVNVFNGDQNIFSHNFISKNTKGLYLYGEGENLIVNNTIILNNLSGIAFDQTQGHLVENNNISNQQFDGIRIIGNSGNITVRNNTIKANRYTGVYIGTSIQNYLNDNAVCFNHISYGFDIYNGGSSIGDNNTCDFTYRWNDTESVGCTFFCGNYSPPVQLSAIPDLTWSEDSNLSLNMLQYFMDPQGSVLSITATAPPNIGLQLGSSVLLFPNQNFFGVRNITFVATNEYQLQTISNVVILNVTSVNDLPFLSYIPNFLGFVGDQIRIQLTAFDYDNDTLIYGTNASSSISTPFNFNSTTGLFEWNTSVTDDGNYSILFYVSDGQAIMSQVVNIVIRIFKVQDFSFLSRDDSIFDWSLSNAYYDGFNHRATLGLLAIPGLPQTDVELNYSFEFNDSITNHGWQGANPLNVFTSDNLSFEGLRSLKVINSVFQHDFNVVLSNQGRKSCMVWYDDGNNLSPSSYVGFDKITTNTAGVFMGYQNNHPPCTSATYCIYSPTPQFWRNTNINRNVGWHQFCMNAKVSGVPDFTWDSIRVLNNTGGTDFDMVSAWNNGATSYIDNVRLWSGYDPNKDTLRCKNLLTEFAFDRVNLSVQQNLNGGIINYSVSNDNGQNWLAISPGIPVLFNTSSQTLTCDIRFTRGPDGNNSPELTYLRFDPGFVPVLALEGSPNIGNTVNLTLTAAYPNAPYIFAMSFNNTPGIDLGDGRVVPLNPDPLFYLTFDPQTALTAGLQSVQGTLDTNGNAQVIWNIPNISQIANLTIYAAFAVINQSAPSVAQAVLDFSSSIPITLQP